MGHKDTKTHSDMAWPQSDPHSAEGLFVPPNPLGKRNPGRRTDTRPNRSREDFSKMIDVDGEQGDATYKNKQEYDQSNHCCEDTASSRFYRIRRLDL